MEYIIRRYSKTGRLDVDEKSRWEKASEEEVEFIRQGKDPSSKNSDNEIPNDAEWIRVVLEWPELVAIQDNYRAMKKRVSGMREAISRWAKKAKDESDDKPELISAERRVNRNDYEYYEHWTIPVPKSPSLAREAWSWVEDTKKMETIQRIYYHHVHGWVAVYWAMW